jgi:hypothetical protein
VPPGLSRGMVAIASFCELLSNSTILSFFHLFSPKNIGHITSGKPKMMCPTFLFMIFGQRALQVISKNQ